MSYLPKYAFPAPPMISPISPESLGIGYYQNTAIASPGLSASWPVANKAIFVPFVLRFPIVVQNLWTNNGGSATGTKDVGIYTEDGRKIISTGSTAGSGTNTLQVYSVTATTIGPGRFYLALSDSGTTADAYIRSNPTVVRLQTLGVYEMTTAFPLPAVATFATIASAYLPMFGLATVSTV